MDTKQIGLTHHKSEFSFLSEDDLLQNYLFNTNDSFTFVLIIDWFYSLKTTYANIINFVLIFSILIYFVFLLSLTSALCIL